MRSHRADEAPLAFGGVWEGCRSPEGEVLRTFAIIITAANREMSALHDRMPLVLKEPAPMGCVCLWNAGVFLDVQP